MYIRFAIRPTDHDDRTGCIEDEGEKYENITTIPVTYTAVRRNVISFRPRFRVTARPRPAPILTFDTNKHRRRYIQTIHRNISIYIYMYLQRRVLNVLKITAAVELYIYIRTQPHRSVYIYIPPVRGTLYKLSCLYTAHHPVSRFTYGSAAAAIL